MPVTIEEGDWHLDKKVPITLIVAIGVNAMAGIWYASKLDNRVANLESTTVEFKMTANQAGRDARDNNDRLIRVEDALIEIKEALGIRRKEPQP